MPGGYLVYCLWNYRLIVYCRNNNKQLDLSLTIRLSGLSSGAKLELIYLSRSTSVVSVALQLPESESQGAPNSRLTDKFPSTTTLWLILRKFESSGGASRNFTARGIPKVAAESGSGRLYYEMPVLQMMGRELSSSTDLQKTLGQLGFNGGSTLMRLSFRVSETPLEEAMGQIGQYFKPVDIETPTNNGSQRGSSTTDHPTQQPQPSITKDIDDLEIPLESTEHSQEPKDPINDENLKPTPQPSANSATDPPSAPALGPNSRPISVFAAPTSTTPRAALQTHNPQDYEVTVDHAKLHQSRLSLTGRNKRLPTYAEIAAQQEEQAQKMAEIKEVEIKVRFPDQTQVVSSFTNEDTGETLYTFVRGVMERENAPLSLRFNGSKGQIIVPKDGTSKLIGKLGMVGRVLVIVVWDPEAGIEVRTGPVLKEAFRQQARELEVKDVQTVDVEDEDAALQKGKELMKDRGKEKGKGGVPKWLKLPGKK